MTPAPDPTPADPARPDTVELWRSFAERLLKSGTPLVAYDALAEGLEAYPGDVRLRQLLALALARTGASRSAIPILEGLKAEGVTDEETLGLLARAHKDLWSDSDDPADRRHHLELAFGHYRDAYARTGGFYSGINAATTALLLGNRTEAAALAARVRAQCRAGENEDPACRTNYWHLATLGEAALILQDWPDAEAAYGRAIEIGRHQLGDIASTRRNARLILRELDADAARFERLFRVPRVVAFAGHLIDRPGRTVPRFPSDIEPAARAAIRERLIALDAGFGYASAASGADIVFLETLLDLGGETTIVLPYGSEEFVRDSVDIVPGAAWARRYAEMLGRAREVVTASDRRMGGGELAYEYAVLLMDGMAGVRADELDTEMVPLVLWDGKPGGGPGGTGSTVDRWRAAGRRVEVIDLAEILQRARGVAVVAPEAVAPPAPAPEQPAQVPVSTPDEFEPEIVALLFADARGFSALTEDQIPAFISHFLGAVAAELSRSPHTPLLKNTWGDGLYFVFGDVSAAGRFALDLSEAIGRIDWTTHGLPAGLSLRIALHAGPAYACIDPVTARRNYLGAHVSRAARIEPITPPGQVYASRAFAAIARAEGVQAFKCEYVGRTPLAKGYGTFPIYVVRHRRRSARLA